MKKFLAAAAGLALLGAASAASAETYGSIGYSQIDLDIGGAGIDLGGVTARVGTTLNTWFGVEGEVSIGVDDQSATVPAGAGVPAGTYSIEMKHQLGVFAVARAPLADGFTVLGRVGYATGKLAASGPGISGEDSGGGVAFGVGAQYDFGMNGVRADFTKYDFDDAEADTLTLSYVRKF